MTTKDPIIILLAEENTSPSVLYGMFDVLYSVGMVFPDMTTGKTGAKVMDVRIVSRDGVPFRCFGNVPIEPTGRSRTFARLTRLSSATCTARSIQRRLGNTPKPRTGSECTTNGAR
jgi:hypothetical protein